MSLSGKKIGIAFTVLFAPTPEFLKHLKHSKKRELSYRPFFLTLHKVSTAVLERLKVS